MKNQILKLKIYYLFKKDIKNDNNVAILVEPIQCTNGDQYFTDNFLQE